MKNTPQRLTVEKIVGECREHPTAEEVYTRAVRVLPNISVATVYRILNTMVEEGRLNRVHVSGNADRYDTVLTPHSHICCLRCGRVDNVSALFIPDKDWISDAKGYSVTGCVMTFEGVCPQCMQKTR